MTNFNDDNADRLEKLIESNAKAIQANSTAIAANTYEINQLIQSQQQTQTHLNQLIESQEVVQAHISVLVAAIDGLAEKLNNLAGK